MRKDRRTARPISHVLIQLSEDRQVPPQRRRRRGAHRSHVPGKSSLDRPILVRKMASPWRQSVLPRTGASAADLELIATIALSCI
jgi:hypothetical protein